MEVGDLVTVMCEVPSGATTKVKGKVGMIIEVFENNDCLVRFINGDVWIFSPEVDEIRLATDEEMRNAFTECLKRW